MDGIEGVVVTAMWGDCPLEIDSADGHVGKLYPDEKVLLDARVQPNRDIYGFTVDGGKNVFPKKDLAEVPEDGKHYQLTVEVMTGNGHGDEVETSNGVYHTEYPNNNLRLLEVRARGGVWVWEIALISQHGEFFLPIQRVYEVCCYRDGETVVCPAFDRWPQMVEFLRTLLQDRIAELAPIAEYQREPKPTSNGVEDGTARVLWFNVAQGLGAVMTTNGQARVHWSHVEKRPRRAFLNPGEIVCYEELREPRRTKTRATAFQQEVVGVVLS